MPKSEFDPLALAHLQMRSHYVLDDQGRIVRVNDIGTAPPRMFAMIRTVAGNVFAAGWDVAPTLAGELLALAAEEPIVEDVENEPVRMLGPAMRLLAPGGASRRRAGDGSFRNSTGK